MGGEERDKKHKNRPRPTRRKCYEAVKGEFQDELMQHTDDPGPKQG